MIDFMRNKWAKYSEYILLVFLYSLVYGIMLFNGAALHDSTVHVNLSRSDLIKYYCEWGNPLIAYLMDFLLGFKNLYLFKFITFISYLTSAFLMLSILKSINEIDSFSRLFITLLFALLPFNDSRVSVGNVLHSLAYVLFYFSYYLVIKYVQYRILILRLFSLAMAFLAFFINSFLVLYAMIIIHLIYIEKVRLSFYEMRKFVLGYIDILTLPVVFWVVKKYYFVSYGYFAGYNEIKLSIRVIYNFINTTYEAFIKFFDFLVYSFFLNSPGLVVIIAVILYFYFVKYCELTNAAFDERNNWKFLALGCMAYILGVLPYAVVGVVGRFFYFESDFYIGTEETRHLCLIPLGMALILYYGLRTILMYMEINSFKVRMIIFSSLLAIVINAGITIYFDYQAQWLYYISLKTNFAKNEIFKNNTTFLVNDSALKYFKFTTGTYIAAFIDSFGDQSRFIITETGLMKESLSYEKYSTNVPPNLFIRDVPRDLTKSELKKLRIEPRFMDEKYKGFYLLADYKPSNFQYEVVICPNPGFALTPRKVLKLTYYEKFKKYEFEKYITDLLSFEFKKIM